MYWITALITQGEHGINGEYEILTWSVDWERIMSAMLILKLAKIKKKIYILFAIIVKAN